MDIMPDGLVIECPVCGNQRPFEIDVDNPPPLLEAKLKLSVKRHLEYAHNQEEMLVYQWEEVVDTMFEADIRQDLLDKLNDDSYQGPKWDDYELR